MVGNEFFEEYRDNIRKLKRQLQQLRNMGLNEPYRRVVDDLMVGLDQHSVLITAITSPAQAAPPLYFSTSPLATRAMGEVYSAGVPLSEKFIGLLARDEDDLESEEDEI